MAFTTPSVRVTGELISASIWNTDLKDNLRYLKGMDGTVAIDNDIELLNNKHIRGKEAGGTLRQMIGMATDDAVDIATSGVTAVRLGHNLLLGQAKAIFFRNVGNTAWLNALKLTGDYLDIGRDDGIIEIEMFGPVLGYDDVASPSQVWRMTPTEGFVSLGMRAHRHPYASNRHIESGEVTHDVLAKSVTYTDAFAAAPVVTTSNDAGGQVFHTATARSTTGHTQNSVGTGGSNAFGQGMWHAEGAD